jgi:hypothetical protein
VIGYVAHKSPAELVVDVALFFVSRATFRREEILTRWK